MTGLTCEGGDDGHEGEVHLYVAYASRATRPEMCANWCQACAVSATEEYRIFPVLSNPHRTDGYWFLNWQWHRAPCYQDRSLGIDVSLAWAVSEPWLKDQPRLEGPVE